MNLDGPKIRVMRENRGMTARDLCRFTSISPSFLSQIEHGDRGCSPHTASRLAKAFGVEIVDLCGGER